MRFRALTEAEWGAVADAMAAQVLWTPPRLLSGEMPEQIEEAFRAVGGDPLPGGRGRPGSTDCTCPDWANPCKHVAAAFYLPRPTGMALVDHDPPGSNYGVRSDQGRADTHYPQSR